MLHCSPHCLLNGLTLLSDAQRVIALGCPVNGWTGLQKRACLSGICGFLPINILEGGSPNRFPGRLLPFEVVTHRGQGANRLIIAVLLQVICPRAKVLLEGCHLFERGGGGVRKVSLILDRFTIRLHVKGGGFRVLPRSIRQ